MLSDFRHAVRTLLKSPGFTLTALVTLAIAIGVNSAVFSLIHEAMYRPLIPVRPNEVVNLFTARKSATKDYRQFSYAEFETLRGAKDTFAEVAATNAVLTGIGRDDVLTRSFAFFVSDNFFALAGTTPEVGRFFTAEESRPNSEIPVVIASYGLWQRFGGKRDFIGSTLRINGEKYTVIGVTRRGFSGLNAMLAPDVWLPLGEFRRFANVYGGTNESMDLRNPRNFTLNLTVRLAPGVTVESLPSRLPALERRLDALQAGDAASSGPRDLQFERPSRYSISTMPTHDSNGTTLAAGVLGMAATVLLVACLNLANMFLARGATRAREIAVRMAIGASRWQIVRQLLIEGLVLSLVGAALGLLVAEWSQDVLLQSLQSLFATMNFSLAINATPGFPVIAATAGMAIAATLLFSLGPAIRASRTDLVRDLKQQVAEPTTKDRLSRFFSLRNILVMAQISLSLALLFAAALFFRGALVAGGANLGFDPQGQLVAELDYSIARRAPAAAQRTLTAAIDRLQQLPRVRAAGLSTQLPYGNATALQRFVDPAKAPAKPDPKIPDGGVDALYTAITPGYFEAMGIPLLRGRNFTALEASDEKSRRVAIIDEVMAKQLFPKGDALGHQIRYTQPPTDGSPAEIEVVGICRAHRHNVLEKSVRARVFVPFAQAYQPSVYLHIRFDRADAAALAGTISTVRAALHEVDPEMPLLGIAPMTSLLERNIELWIVRLGAVMFGIFGGIALVLAAVGVYGVKAYTVARRTREIGIRMALGAHPRDIFALVMRQAVLQTTCALTVGALLAFGVGQLLAALLYQVSPRDPLAFAFTTAVLATAALVACFIPARRATRVSPVMALATE